MFLLPACAEPTLYLPAELPVAENAVRMPATAFIGPLEPSIASDKELCADPPDYEKLLRSGAFGWRVIVLRGDETWIPVDGILQRVDERAVDTERSRFESASRWFAIRCGRASPTNTLLVVDAPTNVVLPDFFVPHLLVRDPNPGEPVAATIPDDNLVWANLYRQDGRWVVLPGDPTSHAAEFARLPDAVNFLSASGAGMALIHLGAADTWGAVVATTDAVAGVGLRTVHTLASEPRPSPPAPLSHQPLALGDDIGVLVRRRWTGGPLLLQMIGTTGNASGDAIADVLGDEGAPMAGLDDTLKGVNGVQVSTPRVAHQGADCPQR